MDTALPSLKVSGSCLIPGGNYDKVHGSGSVRIDGQVIANSLTTSGSLKGHGSLQSETFRVSGSTHMEGAVDVGDGHCSGAFHVDGKLSIRRTMSVSGSALVTGQITGEAMRGSGSLRVGQDVSLDSISWSGSIQCPGLCTAEVIDLKLHGECHIGELAGSQINVSWERNGRWLRWLPLNKVQEMLTVSEVSGDEVTLEATTAQMVRGDRVVIGPQCRIDRVEYRQSLTVDPQSWVGQSVQIS